MILLLNLTNGFEDIRGQLIGNLKHDRRLLSGAKPCTSTKKLTLTWTLYMKQKYGTDTFTVECGTTIVFDWYGEAHGVARIRHKVCPKHPRGYMTIKGGVPSATSTKTVYKTSRPGKLYFSCQVYGHCESGQLIEIKVVPSKVVPPKPSAAPREFCKNKKVGIHPSPFSCKEFYKCGSDQAWKFQCPKGTVFDPKQKVCQADYLIACHTI